jgi:hypothetical protein
MESGTLEVEGLAHLAHALLASAEGSEVLGSLGGDVGVQLKDNPPLCICLLFFYFIHICY